MMSNVNISRTIAVDIDNIIDNSKSIKRDMVRTIADLSSRFNLPESVIRKIATYHAININRYNEHYLLNPESLEN